MSNLEDLLLRKDYMILVTKEVEFFCVSYSVSLDSLTAEAICRCHALSPTSRMCLPSLPKYKIQAQAYTCNTWYFLLNFVFCISYFL